MAEELAELETVEVELPRFMIEAIDEITEQVPLWPTRDELIRDALREELEIELTGSKRKTMKTSGDDRK